MAQASGSYDRHVVAGRDETVGFIASASVLGEEVALDEHRYARTARPARLCNLPHGGGPKRSHIGGRGAPPLVLLIDQALLNGIDAGLGVRCEFAEAEPTAEHVHGDQPGTQQVEPCAQPSQLGVPEEELVLQRPDLGESKTARRVASPLHEGSCPNFHQRDVPLR